MEWLDNFEEETQYFEVKSIRDKVCALKIYRWPEVKKLARNLPETAPVVDDNVFEKMRARMRHQARECKFGNQKDEEFLNTLYRLSETKLASTFKKC